MLKESKIASGGGFKRKINELEASGFIESYIPFGKYTKNLHYRVVDEYILFYFSWIEPFLKGRNFLKQSYWEEFINTPKYNSWAGFAFENICFTHINQVRDALKLEKIPCDISSWRYVPKSKKENGCQIDLLFDRRDGAVTICEIKYSDRKYIVNKEYAKNILNKTNVFEQNQKKEKKIFFAMITTNGVKENSWSKDLVDNEVMLSDLFL